MVEDKHPIEEEKREWWRISINRIEEKHEWWSISTNHREKE
jgi:hypothetical protein